MIDAWILLSVVLLGSLCDCLRYLCNHESFFFLEQQQVGSLRSFFIPSQTKANHANANNKETRTMQKSPSFLYASWTGCGGILTLHLKITEDLIFSITNSKK